LINVSAFRPGHHINLVMNSEKNLAVAYLSTGGIAPAASSLKGALKGPLGQVKGSTGKAM